MITVPASSVIRIEPTKQQLLSVAHEVVAFTNPVKARTTNEAGNSQL
jgi:hypothetical protein